MVKITIGFSKARSKLAFMSALLQAYLGTPYSHVYIRINHKSRFGVDTIYHSSLKSGTSYYSEPIFHKYNETVKEYSLCLKKAEYARLRRNCHQTLGLSYGFWQNLGILAVDLLNFIGLPIKNPWTVGMNCSEAVFLALRSRYKNLDKYDPNTVTPRDIEEILLSKGSKPLQITQ